MRNASPSRVSRRGLLLGGAGTLLAGCGAAEAGPGGTRKGGGGAAGTLVSDAMGGTRVSWTLTAPAGHALDGLPVVIALHGRGGDHTTALRSLRLADAVDEVAGEHPFALATVDGGDHSYFHRRSDGTDAGAMVRTELVQALRRYVDVERIGLFGWSMGGYGALLLAGKDRMPVRAVAVSSPALFTSGAATPAGAFDSAEDFDRNDVYGHPEWLDGRAIRIVCGEFDPFYAATRDFVGRLRPAPASGFGPGGHDAAYWRRVAPAQLRFLGRALHS